jgi:hypothetical protein
MAAQGTRGNGRDVVTATRNRLIAAVAAASICALAAPAGASAGNLLLPTLTVPIPSPGHVTAETLSIKVTGQHALENGNTFEASTPDAGALPKSVRVFSATRAIRTSSSLTYAFYVVAVNKRKAGSAGAATAQAAATSLVKFRSYRFRPSLHALILRFTKPAKGNGSATGSGHATSQRIYCDSCTGEATVQAVLNTDAATTAVAAPLTADIKDLFSSGGATASIFNRVHVARYDNGHAFKVKKTGPRKALKGVADDLLGQKPETILQTVKSALGTGLG